MRTRLLIPLLAVVMAVAAACSSDSADTTTSAPAPIATPTTTTTVAPTTTAAPTTTTTTSAPADIDPAASAAIEAALANAESGSWEAEGVWEITGDLDGSGTVATAVIGYSGAYDADTGNSRTVLDLSGMGALGVTAGGDIPPELADAFTGFETRVIDGISYLRFPLFSMMFGATTEWISLPEEDSSAATSFLPFASFGDVNTAVGGLDEGLVDVTEIGGETVNGVSTTHYQVVVDAARLDAGTTEGLPVSGEQAIDVWIDDDGYLRRYQIDIESPQLGTATGAGAERALITVDFTSIGEPVMIEAPDPAEVTDLSEMMASLSP